MKELQKEKYWMWIEYLSRNPNVLLQEINNSKIKLNIFEKWFCNHLIKKWKRKWDI